MSGVAKRVAGGGIFKTYERADVACVNLFDFGTVVRVHHEDTTDAFFLVLGGVKDVRTRLKSTRVATEERELADERVRHDLECKTGERRRIAGFALFDGNAVHERALDVRNVERGRHIVDDSVEQFLHALVLERTAAGHGIDLHFDREFADSLFDFFYGEVRAFVFEVSLHKRVVRFGDDLEEFSAVFVRLIDVFRGNIGLVHNGAEVVFVNVGFHGDEVDNAHERFGGTDRKLDSDRGSLKVRTHHIHDVEEVRAVAVHLVDVSDTGNAVLVRLAPDGFGLRLNAAACAEHRDRAVENLQRTFDFDGEVDVTRGIDDVDTGKRLFAARAAVDSPLGGGSRGSNGYTAFLLLFHPVHGSRALVDFADFVSFARVIKDTLGRRGFTRVDVSHNTDITRVFQTVLSRHSRFSE